MKRGYLLWCLLFGLNSFAQTDFHCSHPSPTTQVLKEMHELQQSRQKSDAKRIFPVVFHVLNVGGSENITEAQILDGLTNLNEDFQKLNADTVEVVSPFDTIIGNPNFEFRLATIDPDGHPTNGIDRIYTPLTNYADENSKINAWDPTRYINIWIVKSFNESGISGSTSNPLVNTGNLCETGVMILHNYVGTIGTGFGAVRHNLTHEMAHFFGMFHLSQEFGTPGGPSCNYSDGIYDTPHQTSSYVCNFTENTCNDSLDMQSLNYWGYDVKDMVQNFVAQTYCARFFTKGQASMMRAVHENPIYGLWSLSDSANLAATGVANGTIPPYSAPSATFSLQHSAPNSNNSGSYDLICAGTSVHYIIQNGNPPNTSYLWSFPGGTPASDTIINPLVSYAQPGYYQVALSATNVLGSNTITQNEVVYVSGDWAEYTGPTQLSFDDHGDFWLQYNKCMDPNKFTWIPDFGQNNTGCFRLKSRFNPDTTIACWAQGEDQIARNRYDLISPAFDLRSTTSTTISFDYAHGSSTTTFPGIEFIKLYSSRDCGRSWVLRKTINDSANVSSYVIGSNEYIPNSSDWRTVTVPYLSNSLDNKTRFKIEFTSSNESNYVYIDNFRIEGVLGISEIENGTPVVHPNPIQENELLEIEELIPGNYQLDFYNVQGQIVQIKHLLVSTGNSIRFDPELKSGYYLFKITGPVGQFIYRIIIH